MMKIKDRVKTYRDGGILLQFGYKIKFRNPCKKCLVVAACRTQCEDSYNFRTTKSRIILRLLEGFDGIRFLAKMIGTGLAFIAIIIVFVLMCVQIAR